MGITWFYTSNYMYINIYLCLGLGDIFASYIYKVFDRLGVEIYEQANYWSLQEFSLDCVCYCLSLIWIWVFSYNLTEVLRTTSMLCEE